MGKMADEIVLKIFTTLVLAIVMFVTTIIIAYLGRKNHSPNTALLATLPLFRGLEWLIEVFADYSADILEIEVPFLTDRLEISFGFGVAIVILAICLEFNGMIQRPLGKIAASLVSVIPIFLLFVLSSELVEQIEDTTMFEDLLFTSVTSEPFRFLYGFLIPVVAIVILLLSYIWYEQHVKHGKIFKDEKMRAKVSIISILIFATAIFNGFDYSQNEVLLIIFRGITMALLVFLPLFIIFEFDYGLQSFLVIQHTGIPILAYNFKTKKDTFFEDQTQLAGGFVSALIAYSSEISEELSKFLTIRSQKLYYLIKNSKTKKIYALQSVSYSKDLETKTLNTIQQLDDLIAEKNELSDVERSQMISTLRNEFAIYT
jgi:hypothetical protein